MKTIKLYKGRNYTQLLKTLCIFSLITSNQLLVTGYCSADSLSRAEGLYLQGSYSDSIEECAVNISQNKETERAYYLLGLNYLKLNDPEKAREKLNILIDNYGSSHYINSAKLSYADSYFIEQDYLKAKTNYENILRNNPAQAASAYLGLARCALKTGDWQKGKDYAQLIQQKFPQSLEARLAKDLFSGGAFFFTVQVGSFANQKNAQRLMQKLINTQFEAYIDQLNSGAVILYRVRVGKLDSRPEAEKLKNNLEQKGYPARIYP